MIYGLIFGCPFMKENHDCPFKNIRQMPLETRVRCVDQMNQLDICHLIEYHSNCLYHRENTISKFETHKVAV